MIQDPIEKENKDIRNGKGCDDGMPKSTQAR